MTKFQRLMCWLMLLTTIYFTCLVLWQSETQCEYGGKEDLKRTTSFVEPIIIKVDDKTTFTAYNLLKEQTDNTPCIGAGNHNLCELRPILKEKGISICASRDLPLHTLIYIENIGECEILDRLNVRYKGTNRVDILMKTRQEALNFGKRELNYVIVK